MVDVRQFFFGRSSLEELHTISESPKNLIFEIFEFLKILKF